MNLETTYYTLAIICMSLSLILLISLVILVFYIWKKVVQIQKYVEEKLDDITNRPAEIAGEIGAAVVGQAVKKASDYLSGRKKK